MKKIFEQLEKALHTKSALLVIIFGIIAVNTFCYNRSEVKPFDDSQARKDATGFAFILAHKFAYFHYYTGHFPLATLNRSLEFSKESAQKEIKNNGGNLIMEYAHWSRLGENARIWAFMPNSILKGSPENPSIKLFNALTFTLALIVLFAGFWSAKYSLQGLLLVIIINATPFFLYEIYTNRNIFGLLGSIFFMVLGLNIKTLITKKPKLRKQLVLGILSAIIIGLYSEIRNEISLVFGSLLLIYLFWNRLKFHIRIAFLIVLFAFYYGTKSTIKARFDNNFNKTAELVKKYDGHVYTGKRIEGHRIWHPIFCGLGDFDTIYGYKWDDRVPYRYAAPILRDSFGIDLAYNGNNRHTHNYYDKDSLYYVKFDEIDEYESIVKNKVVSDISENPNWYIDILGKRFNTLFTVTLPIAYMGWLLFPLGIFLIITRKWNYLKLLAISLPLSATSIIIYSGHGSTYNSVFGYAIILVIILLLVNLVLKSNKVKRI